MLQIGKKNSIIPVSVYCCSSRTLFHRHLIAKKVTYLFAYFEKGSNNLAG